MQQAYNYLVVIIMSLVLFGPVLMFFFSFMVKEIHKCRKMMIEAETEKIRQQQLLNQIIRNNEVRDR